MGRKRAANSKQTGKAKVLRPASMKQVAEIASDLRRVLVDSEWIDIREQIDEIRLYLGQLHLAINDLPWGARSGKTTLVYRLARAEAERINGALHAFEVTFNAGLQANKTPPPNMRRQLAREGFTLMGILGAFLVASRGL